MTICRSPFTGSVESGEESATLLPSEEMEEVGRGLYQRNLKQSKNAKVQHD